MLGAHVPPGQPPARGMGTLAADDCAFVPRSAGEEILRVFPPNPTVWLEQQVYTATGNHGWAYIATDDLEPYVPQAQYCPE